MSVRISTLDIDPVSLKSASNKQRLPRVHFTLASAMASKPHRFHSPTSQAGNPKANESPLHRSNPEATSAPPDSSSATLAAATLAAATSSYEPSSPPAGANPMRHVGMCCCGLDAAGVEVPTEGIDYVTRLASASDVVLTGGHRCFRHWAWSPSDGFVSCSEGAMAGPCPGWSQQRDEKRQRNLWKSNADSNIFASMLEGILCISWESPSPLLTCCSAYEDQEYASST